MAWYQKKPRYKLRDAFRETFFEQFEDQILNIENMSLSVLREANLSSMAKTKHIGLTADSMNRRLEQVMRGQFDSRLSLDRVIRDLAELKYQHEQSRLDLQGYTQEVRQLAVSGMERIKEFESRLLCGIQIGNRQRQQLLWDAERDMSERQSRAIGMWAPDFEFIINKPYRTSTNTVTLS